MGCVVLALLICVCNKSEEICEHMEKLFHARVQRFQIPDADTYENPQDTDGTPIGMCTVCNFIAVWLLFIDNVMRAVNEKARTRTVFFVDECKIYEPSDLSVCVCPV